MPENILPPLPKIPNVEIRPIPWAPGYCVSSSGLVFCCIRGGQNKRIRRWRRLKGSFHPYGKYPIVSVKNRRYITARLILEVFVGPCPENMEACHNDGNNRNNDISNLRWDTRLNNVRDAIKHGVFPKGERSGATNLTNKDILDIRQKYASGAYTQLQLSEEYSVNRSNISVIVNGKSWKELPLDRQPPNKRNYKLCMQEKEEIVRLYNKKVSAKLLSKMFKINHMYVTTIVRKHHKQTTINPSENGGIPL